jgi:hypothetical protein
VCFSSLRSATVKTRQRCPRFIKAYRAEEIRLDQLEALAITDDQQAQEKVWDSLRHDWERYLNVRKFPFLEFSSVSLALTSATNLWRLEIAQRRVYCPNVMTPKIPLA